MSFLETFFGESCVRTEHVTAPRLSGRDRYGDGHRIGFCGELGQRRYRFGELHRV